MIPELLSIQFSPWSERARWALDARHVQYTKKIFQPLLGEPALRFRTKRFAGNVTVPVLFTSDGFFADSLSIAKWANSQGEGHDLFPAVHAATLARLHQLSETALAAGRALSLRRTLQDDDAISEFIPKQLRPLGGLSEAIARAGIKRTLAKYRAHRISDGEQRQTMRAALLQFREALGLAPQNAESATTLLGTFSFADITVAQALTFVVPPTHATFRIKDATKRVFRDPEFSLEFADLIVWRDALYTHYRTI